MRCVGAVWGWSGWRGGEKGIADQLRTTARDAQLELPAEPAPEDGIIGHTTGQHQSECGVNEGQGEHTAQRTDCDTERTKRGCWSEPLSKCTYIEHAQLPSKQLPSIGWTALTSSRSSMLTFRIGAPPGSFDSRVEMTKIAGPEIWLDFPGLTLWSTATSRSGSIDCTKSMLALLPGPPGTWASGMITLVAVVNHRSTTYPFWNLRVRE